ncbi:hypothetical protein AB0E69_03350 [Kribbella sp. NPDC026611]|uniref:hypothetical protein n=1 Tax=Kribbella sp. NPDC026611 TaxID=3154911 RepID=UPI00340D3C2F
MTTTAINSGQAGDLTGRLDPRLSHELAHAIDGRLGDAIDDRVADALEDYLAEGRLDGRIRPRRSPGGLAALIAAGVAAVLLPWCLILAATLPSTYQVNHWKLAWIGLDCGTAIAAGLTAYLLRKGNRYAVLTAMAAGTLLATDAWFDVSTAAAGFDRTLSLTEALLLELPLALCAFAVAARELRRS